MEAIVQQPQSKGLDAAYDRMAANWEKFKKNRAQSGLEKYLQKLLEAAYAHRDRGTPNGDEVFVRIWLRADKAINDFTSRYNVPRSDVEDGWVAIHDLQALAGLITILSPEDRLKNWAEENKTIIGISMLGATVMFFLSAFATGVWYDIYKFTTVWSHYIEKLAR